VFGEAQRTQSWWPPVYIYSQLVHEIYMEIYQPKEAILTNRSDLQNIHVSSTIRYKICSMFFPFEKGASVACKCS
jgi:hypothetical protein